MPDSRPHIHINGSVNLSLSEDLIELVIEESLWKPASCLVRLNNIGVDRDGKASFKYFDLTDFDFGSPFAIWLGIPPASLYPLFKGKVQLIETDFKENTPPEILIQSEDIFQEMKRRIRTRIFEDLSDADVIQNIAVDYNLTTDIDLPGDPHSQLTQLNQSDYDFLISRVREAGGNLRIDNDQLTVKTDDLLNLPPLELNVGDELIEFQARADLRGQSTSLGIAGWNMRDKEVLRQSSDEQDLSGANAAVKGGGRTTEEAFGQSLANVVDSHPASADEAEHLARAYYRERARQFMTGTGLSRLSWELKAGRKVEIKRAGKLFDGVYTVTAVRHRYDQVHSLRTEFEVERSFMGTAQRKQQGKKHA